MPIWNEEYETMPRSELESLQLERLRDIVAYAAERVPFYRHAMAKAGLTAADIHDLDDLARLPFTNKQDLRDNYPFKMFAVPLTDVVRIHASSGTTGKPTVGGYTVDDLDLWREGRERKRERGGGGKKEIVHNA